jgi:hypothetical protein
MKIIFRNIILLISILLLNNNLFGQNLTFDKIDDLANTKSKELLNNKEIDKILIYSVGCIGCERISLNECECNLGYKTTYLMWKDSENFRIQIIDCCGIQKSELISLDNIWDSIDNNSEEIFQSKYFTEYETSHYSFTDIRLLVNNKILESNLKSYFFDESNSYFNQNKSQPMNDFKKMVALKIREFENKKE